jgi:hypothetical protein
MSVVVFCGPTISAADVTDELAADVRGPAARGDFLGAALRRPDAILLIDGYFDRVPSVWHKEILWALSQGIHVFGASSMGALRAAELAPFGVVGLGEIYAAFAGGELEDDDEVAVVHGDAESGYRGASEAMVNIRWTLRAAERKGVIGEGTRLRLEARSKALPYYERDLRVVLDVDHAEQTTARQHSEVSTLRQWLPHGRVDQKRADAVAALRHVAALGRAGWQPQTASFRMAETDGWVSLLAEIEGADGRRRERVVDQCLEDELRARGILGRTLLAGTMRFLAADRLRTAGLELNARAVEKWIDVFRRERGLFSGESFETWLHSTALLGADLENFFCREAVVCATRSELRESIGAAVEDELKAAGQLHEVQSFAARKKAALARRGLGTPSLEDAGLTEPELWQWYFRDRLRMPIPESIAAYAAGEGSTVEELRLAALRDVVFRRLSEGAASGSLNPALHGTTS